MFTGLVEALGRVASFESRGAAGVLAVAAGLPLAEIRLGDSIAVNGACLTVVDKGSGVLTFDVSPESLSCSTFRHVRPGHQVNLERALRLSDRLDGHLVSGHVDCIATIVERKERDGNSVFTFRIPSSHARYVVAKGSVAVDGISLTINSVGSDRFTVNVIPLTTEKTTLKLAREGDEVNIETDIIGKYLERLLVNRPQEAGGLSLELLAKSGFV